MDSGIFTLKILNLLLFPITVQEIFNILVKKVTKSKCGVVVKSVVNNKKSRNRRSNATIIKNTTFKNKLEINTLLKKVIKINFCLIQRYQDFLISSRILYNKNECY